MLYIFLCFVVDSESSDVEGSHGVDAATGNCLGQSMALPSGILQIKKCRDANSDRPAKVYYV